MDFFLADDLSGALDAAAAFHHAGRRVRVVLSAKDWPGAADDDVIGITTETRNADPATAARLVTQAIARGQAAGGKLLYKKIDSTLRGPVAAELAALAAALPEARILFTPANPRVGRTVRDGVLRVHGVPVAETDFARDPLCPVRESSITRLLGGANSSRVTIADAETEDDLAAAVKRMDADGGDWVAVGSGALARPVAARTKNIWGCGALAASSAERGEGAASPNQAVLMIGGSAHAANRAQAAMLAREHGVKSHEVDVADIGGTVRAAVADLRAGSSAALVLPETRIDSGLALEAVTQAAKRVIADAGVTRVFATGGETAFALCRELGISSLHYLKEIEAGLALARAGALLLAVKPGGFGDERTWIRAWTELRAAK